MQREGAKQIKSVKQLAQQIRNAKTEFERMLGAVGIGSITLEEDLTKRTPTIETVLKDLPSEHRLREMMEHPYAETPQIRQRILASYKGKYEIIRRAADNLENLKTEAEKIYYLAAELNLFKIKNEFDPERPEGIVLKNYEVYANDNLRLPRYEKNMLNPHYLQELREEELQSGAGPNEYLPVGEAVLTLALYDSINGEKTFEYNCHGEQTLLEVASKFYCMIARLEGREANHWGNSYFLIEENFFYQGNVARRKIEEIIAFPSHAQNYDEEEQRTEPQHALFEMGKTKLKSLRVVFGRPYLFRHLEGCDHIVIFKDLHILVEGQGSEPALRNKYPLITFEGRMRKRKCDGCRGKYADRVSLNDPLKAGKHLYICKDCHDNLHPDPEDGCVRYLHD